MNFFEFFDVHKLDYNILGEFASAIISLVLLVNVIITFTWSLRKERLFFFASLGCFVSCVTDIFSVFTITNFSAFPIPLCIFISSLYFLSLVIIPFSMAGYAYEVAFPYRKKENPIIYGVLVFFSLYVIIMLINIKTGWVFTFKPEIGYVRGPLKTVTYFMSFMAMIFIEVIVIPHKKSMSSRLFYTMIMYPVPAVAILLIQLFNPTVLCTGTASIAGMLFAYMSVQNEMSQFDTETGLMTEKKLEKHFHLKNNTGVLYVLNIDNIGTILNNVEINEVNKLLLRIGKELSRLFDRHAYHLAAGRFAAIASNIEEVQNNADIMDELIKTLNEEYSYLNLPLEVYSVAVENTNKLSTYSALKEIVTVLLTKAKRAENNRLLICDKSILDDMERKRIIFNILKRELNADSTQFQVWYQPIYSIKEDKFVYMEALSRLRGTELGDISPGEFVEVAENKGLIMQLGRVVFEKICKFISENSDTVAGVSVNFSIEQLEDPELSQRVLKLLGEYKLEASRVIFEVTESLELHNSKIVRKNMETLASYGIKFYLDDFGTGFSNIAQVVRLPFNTIKIDRTLVLMMEQSRKNFDLVKNFVTTFKAAEFNILVEGVETELQRARVVSINADYIQGYFYSKPLPPEECLQKLKEGPVPQPQEEKFI